VVRLAGTVARGQLGCKRFVLAQLGYSSDGYSELSGRFGVLGLCLSFCASKRVPAGCSLSFCSVRVRCRGVSV